MTLLMKKTTSLSIFNSHLVSINPKCTRCFLEKGEIKVSVKLDEVPVAEDVFGVHVVLDRLKHAHADIRDGLSHPLLPKFPH